MPGRLSGKARLIILTYLKNIFYQHSELPKCWDLASVACQSSVSFSFSHSRVFILVTAPLVGGVGLFGVFFPPFPGPRLAHGIKVKIAPARRVCSSFLLTDRFSGYASSTSHNNSQQPRHSRARAIPLFSIMPGLVFRDPPPWNPLSNATIIRKGKKIHAKTDMITNFVARGDKRAGKQSNISRSKEIR